MSYASVQLMVDEFGARELDMIADRDRNGAFEPAVIQKALDTATEQINFAVAQRCQLPLVSPSAEVIGMLSRWCMDIARYRLSGSSGVVVTDDVHDRYKEARDDLDRIIAGKIVLCKQGDTQNGLSATDLTAGMVESFGAERVINSSRLSEFCGVCK